MIPVLSVPDGDYSFDIYEAEDFQGELANVELPVKKKIGKLSTNSEKAGAFLRVSGATWALIDANGNPAMSGTVQRPPGHLHICYGPIVVAEVGAFGLGTFGPDILMLRHHVTAEWLAETQKKQDEIWRSLR